MQTWMFLAISLASYWLYRRLTRKTPLGVLPGPVSSSCITGNMLELIDRHGWNFHKQLSQDYGSVLRLNGLFNESILYVFDPQALEQLLVKDPGCLDQAPEALTSFHMIFGPGMAGVPADRHRKQRRIINPAFSANQLRELMPVFFSNARTLADTIASVLAGAPTEMDMYPWLCRVSLEIIAQAGLGCSFDPLTIAATVDEHGHNMKSAVGLLVELPVLRQILPVLTRVASPDTIRHILQYYSPNAKARDFARFSSAIIRRSHQIYQDKKLALQQGDETLVKQIGEGKDILSLLIKANLAASERDKLQDDEAASQISVMTIAAMDTTSSVMAQLLHRLATRPDIQDNVRQEVLESGCDIAASSGNLLGLPWLNAVYRETLRVNAPAPLVMRRTIKDIILPLSRPVKCTNGTKINEVPVPKGTSIFIGVYGSNLSKDLWGDDATEWKPERWISDLPQCVKSIPGVYANLMSFVAGPRSCIGFKFAEMEIKILLSVLLSRFEFALGDKEVYWNMGHIIYPTASPNSDIDGQLFLKVTPLHNVSY